MKAYSWTLVRIRTSKDHKMKIAFRVSLVLIAAAITAAVALYINARAEYEADRAACPQIEPIRAAEAVVHDIIRPGNQIFNGHQLAPQDITVDVARVQTGTTAVLVPFSLSTEPDRKYFGMPRCAELSSIEYAHN